MSERLESQSAASSTVLAGEKDTLTDEQVFEQERTRAIPDRRKAAWKSVIAQLPPGDQKQAEKSVDDAPLVGLALSGGGIRSALFNLGLLQALSQVGFLRAVDYISSVSGGGYISGYLAALAQRHHESDKNTSFHDALATGESSTADERIADLGLGPSDQLTPRFRFLHVGDYLFRPLNTLGFLYRYVVATLMTWAFTVGLLGAVACCLALLWRWFDNPEWRDLLSQWGMIDFSRNLGLGGETLIAFIPAFVFGVVWLISAVGTFAYRHVKGVDSTSRLEKVTRFVFLAFCISLGVSTAILLGNGEMSVNSAVPDAKRKLLEYTNGPLWLITLASLLVIPSLRFRSVLNSANESAPQWQQQLFRMLLSFASFCGPFYLVYWMGRENISGFVTSRGPEIVRGDVEDCRAAEAMIAASKLDKCSWYPSIKNWTSKKQEAENREREVRGTGWDRKASSRLLYVRIVNPEKMSIWRDSEKEARIAEDSAVEAWNEFLKDSQTTKFLVERLNARGESDRNRILEKLANSDVKSLISTRQDGLVTLVGKESFKDDIRMSLNRTLVDLCYPTVFRDRADVSTIVLAASGHDQNARVHWLVFWVFLFLIGSSWEWNHGSPLFRYYRRCLVSRFLDVARAKNDPNSVKDGKHDKDDLLPKLIQGDIRLFKLSGWRSGAPYPLFSACMQFFDETRPRDALDSGDDSPHQRSRAIQPFVFSPLYCGSNYLGYEEMKKYCGGALSVGDAIAISGAAVTPFMARSLSLRILMAICNFRLGQWLPVPGCYQGKGRPWVFAWQIIDRFISAKRHGNQGVEQAKLAFAADGGFHEYLGLEELIRRRCQLIVVSDAGCNNGKFEFGVLADVLRMCRVRHGVHFMDLDHDLPLDLAALRRNPDTNEQEMHFICFRVRYPEANLPDGLVVYAQMSLTGREDVDLQQFRNINPNFPDEPTTNQAYTKDQVESYRQLGCHIGRELASSLDRGQRKKDEKNACKNPAAFWTWAFRNSYRSLRWQQLSRDLPQPSSLYRGDLEERRSLTTASPPLGEYRNQSADALKGYFDSLSYRQEQYSKIEELIEQSSIEDNTDVRPAPSDAASIMNSLLACHARFTGGAFASQSTIFQPGGRENLIGASIYWLYANELCANDPAYRAQAMVQGSLADSATKMARLLKDDVFCSAENETIGLSIAVLLYNRPGLRLFSIDEVARRVSQFVRGGDYGGLRRYLSFKEKSEAEGGAPPAATIEGVAQGGPVSE